MTEVYFYKRLKEYLDNLDDDWDHGVEVDDDVRIIIDLCKRFLEEKHGVGKSKPISKTRSGEE